MELHYQSNLVHLVETNVGISGSIGPCDWRLLGCCLGAMRGRRSAHLLHLDLLPLNCRYIDATLLLHCRYTSATLPLHCRYTAAILPKTLGLTVTALHSGWFTLHYCHCIALGMVHSPLLPLHCTRDGSLSITATALHSGWFTLHKRVCRCWSYRALEVPQP